LDGPLFYQLLLAELYVSAEDPGAGYSLLLDAARQQRDADLFKRAVEVALQARSGDAALSAARAWAQDLPQQTEAQRYVLQILVALNRLPETTPVLRNLLERSNASERQDVLLEVPQLFARVSDPARALTAVREALSAALKNKATAAAASVALGRMELALNQLAAALASAQRGHQAEPASPYPALLALELLERGQADAETLVQRHLQVTPITPTGLPSVALGYARLLLDQERYSNARSQLIHITEQQPLLAEAWLLLATLHVQNREWPAANAALQRYMPLAEQAADARSARGLTQAYLLMAQIAEQQGDLAASSAWLDRIENAQDIMAAQMRRASLLARQGKLDEARALLRQLPERRPEDARLKLLSEAALLRDLKAWPQALTVYAELSQRYPDDADLLYDHAMVAEKAGQRDDMERLLRRLMTLQPDNAHAYNALGYSLTERNERLPEARQLIEKAVQLAPDDAYIQDSLGWVEFKLGNTGRALEILQAAYRKRPNAEIAAHLGEVLWVLNRRDEALTVWREGLLLARDDEVLLDTLQRFQVKP
jgi:tetratricopeptide (TPR) repeat protein